MVPSKACTIVQKLLPYLRPFTMHMVPLCFWERAHIRAGAQISVECTPARTRRPMICFVPAPTWVANHGCAPSHPSSHPSRSMCERLSLKVHICTHAFWIPDAFSIREREQGRNCWLWYIITSCLPARTLPQKLSASFSLLRVRNRRGKKANVT